MTRRHKYNAVSTFVLPDLTKFTREDLLRLAASRQVPTSVPRRHRRGPPTLRPLSLTELALALQFTGIGFTSALEADRYIALRREELEGRIHDLRRQVRFELHAGNYVHIGVFVADFVYVRDDQTVIEDTKGVRTALYVRSKKHIEAEYGVVVTEVRQLRNRVR